MSELAESGRISTARFAQIRIRPWPYFGGLAFVCLVIQAITGIVMAFNYQPTPDSAYVSSYYISNVMDYGWFVRTVHVWGAHLTIIFSALHAIAVFVSASYRRTTRGNWFVGVVGLLAVVALSFTGNLLPWDQAAFWDTTSAISLFEEAPIVGEWLTGFMLGGDTLGAAALTRFYAAHLTILPAAVVGLLLAHIWVSRRRRTAAVQGPLGESTPVDSDDSPTTLEASGEKTAPLYPDLAVSAATTLVLLLSLFAVLAILLPAGLDVKADPSVALETAKPAWYFLSLYALAEYLPAPLAATLTFGLGVLFALLPFLDRTASTAPRDRVVALAVGLIVIGGVASLTLAGALL